MTLETNTLTFQFFFRRNCSFRLRHVNDQSKLDHRRKRVIYYAVSFGSQKFLFSNFSVFLTLSLDPGHFLYSSSKCDVNFKISIVKLLKEWKVE